MCAFGEFAKGADACLGPKGSLGTTAVKQLFIGFCEIREDLHVGAAEGAVEEKLRMLRL